MPDRLCLDLPLRGWCLSMHALVQTPKAVQPAPATRSLAAEPKYFGHVAGPIDGPSRFGHDLSRIPARSRPIGLLQAKLRINEPGDPYEREADRVSERVMRMQAADIAQGAL